MHYHEAAIKEQIDQRIDDIWSMILFERERRYDRIWAMLNTGDWIMFNPRLCCYTLPNARILSNREKAGKMLQAIEALLK